MALIGSIAFRSECMKLALFGSHRLIIVDDPHRAACEMAEAAVLRHGKIYKEMLVRLPLLVVDEWHLQITPHAPVTCEASCACRFGLLRELHDTTAARHGRCRRAHASHWLECAK